ncbi:hypothetical protein ABAZ39_11535 [Azospirillum argentinense]|uniref:Uncharacterized protein n=1 Tax=Azospirillum argentinense TaxID=2970906 RepID=A0A060DND9_9PROT|nr:hypothetical protein [Azospirillum argentinense]AIB12613.1 hypothetical protein ABAZ39_11535 [Azospirillum argentinense]EZQ09403.1 hypothetical protein ABAZ39_12965 [Azospirillum argentinense]
MGRPGFVVAEIRALLEPYLDEQMAAWERQPEAGRQPTLPMIGDKVSVRGLTRALGLKISREQYFYDEPELASLVNAVAEAQGLLPIGSRAQLDAEDKAVAERITRAQADRSDLARTLAEREALIERQRREIEALRGQLALLEETGMVMRTGKVR